MLFIVTLTYRRPPNELERQLDDHRAWLATNTRRGSFIIAGPLASKTGGLIIAHAATREELDAIVATDPFVNEGLVDVEVRAVAPAIRHAEFPVRWAAAAEALLVD
jgi:uncharacterized protein YciI